MTERSARAPRPKVLASTAGAGLGVPIAAFVVGMLDDHVYDPTLTGSVPEYVVGLVMAGVPVLLAFAAGYWQGEPDAVGEHRRDDAGEVDLGSLATWVGVLAVVTVWWLGVVVLGVRLA